jgi:hypothetical protein
VCENVRTDMYEMLTKHGDTPALHWYCVKCNQGFAKVLTSVSRLENMYKKMEEKMEVIELKVDSNSENMGDLKSSLEDLIEKKLEERDDRRRREANLVIFNLPESTADSATTAQVEDEQEFREILQNVLDMSVPPVTKYRRIGKKSDKTRPLCVTIPDRDARIEILRNTRKLQGSKYDKIAINRDYTVEQRESNRDLRKELQAKKVMEPTGNFTIRRGKVVRLQTSAGAGEASDFRK